MDATIKHLKRVTAFLWIATAVLFFISLLINNILPQHGYSVIYDHTGTSMLPTILDNDLLVASGNVPFSDLEAEDIIVFKDYDISQQSNYWKSGEEPLEQQTGQRYLEGSFFIHRVRCKHPYQTFFYIP